MRRAVRGLAFGAKLDVNVLKECYEEDDAKEGVVTAEGEGGGEGDDDGGVDERKRARNQRRRERKKKGKDKAREHRQQEEDGEGAVGDDQAEVCVPLCDGDETRA